MLKRLIEHVAGLAAEEVESVPIQDLGICVTWYNSCANDPAMVEKWAAIPKAVAAWAARNERTAAATEGRRTQWLLRDLIQDLQDGKLDELTWEELDFLCTVHALCERAADRETFERVHGLLEPHVAQMKDRKKALKKPRGLPALSDRLHVVTAEDIEKAKPKQIKVFAGIEMPSMGPVLVNSGHLKVLGSVPDNCTVVVGHGSCCVEGFVLGKVAARRHCDVLENISGVVVVRQGDVRARNIIDNAVVVSKLGSVHCRQGQNPKLVYADKEIRVADGSVLGTYISPRIQVEGEARGGIFHTSRLVSAERFAHMVASEPRIVLRRKLSCRDYGETTETRGSRLVRRSQSMRHRLSRLRTMQRNAEAEAEWLANNMIAYLCASERSVQHFERIHAAQRRLSFLKRLFQGMLALAQDTEERIETRTGTVKETDDGQADEAEDTSYSEVDNELEILVLEGGVDRDLSAAMGEMVKLRNKVTESLRDPKRTCSLLMGVRERLVDYVKETHALTDQLEKSDRELARIAGKMASLVDTQGSRSKVQQLRRIMTANQDSSMDAATAKRANTPFAALMLRKMEKRVALAKEYRRDIEDLEEQLKQVTELLGKKYPAIAIQQDISGEGPAKAVGRFDAGVRIYADPFLLDETDPSPNCMLVTEDSGQQSRTYARSEAGTVVPCD